MREIHIQELYDYSPYELISEEFNLNVDLYLQNTKIFIEEVTNRIYVITQNKETLHLGICNCKNDEEIKLFCLRKLEYRKKVNFKK